MKTSFLTINKATKLPIYVATNAHKKASPKWVRDNTDLWIKKERTPGYGNGSFFGKNIILTRKDYLEKPYKYKALCINHTKGNKKINEKIILKKIGYSNRDVVLEQIFAVNPVFLIKSE